MYVLGTKDSSDSEQSRAGDKSAQYPVELTYVHTVTVLYLQTVPSVPSWTVGTSRAESRCVLIGIPGGLSHALQVPRVQQMSVDKGVLAFPLSSPPCDRG